MRRARIGQSRAGSSITVIDLGKIAQQAVADRRQQRTGRADIVVATRIVAKLVLAKEALADRRSRVAVWERAECNRPSQQASTSSILK